MTRNDSEWQEEMVMVIEPILRIFQKLKFSISDIQTITPAQYNYHRPASMPTAQTLMKRTGKSWNEILRYAGIPPIIERKNLARLSNSLHLLAKLVVDELGLGWMEKSFLMPAGDEKDKHYIRARPDFCCMEHLYLSNGRLILLDVKLSIRSAGITIYKYLPLFQRDQTNEANWRNQQTFFPQWLPGELAEIDPICPIEESGQLNLFLEHDILYICYLLGDPVDNLPPGSKISSILHKHHRGKRSTVKHLPQNMEVRFLPFFQLSELYCKLAGIEYIASLQHKITPIMEIARIIKSLASGVATEIQDISKSVYRILKSNAPIPLREKQQEIAGIVRNHLVPPDLQIWGN